MPIDGSPQIIIQIENFFVFFVYAVDMNKIIFWCDYCHKSHVKQRKGLYLSLELAK